MNSVTNSTDLDTSNRIDQFPVSNIKMNALSNANEVAKSILLKHKIETKPAELVQNVTLETPETSINTAIDVPKKKRRRASRWQGSEYDKTYLPGVPTAIATELPQEELQCHLLQVKIEDLTQKLKRGQILPPVDRPRSPSPEPIYDQNGKRLNTREVRYRQALEQERHDAIQQMKILRPNYIPPVDYRVPRVQYTDKVFIPQEEHPTINFIGLIIGPRGESLKTLEKDTGAKIIIRGKGSVKESKLAGRPQGMKLPGEDEPLHAWVSSNEEITTKTAAERIKIIIKNGIEIPEDQNARRCDQLKQLAMINGTYRYVDGLNKLNQIEESRKIYTNAVVCTKCGNPGHIVSDCMFANGDEIPGGKNHVNLIDHEADPEYANMLLELGDKKAFNILENSSLKQNDKSAGKSGGSIFTLQAAPEMLTEGERNDEQTKNGVEANEKANGNTTAIKPNQASNLCNYGYGSRGSMEQPAYDGELGEYFKSLQQKKHQQLPPTQYWLQPPPPPASAIIPQMPYTLQPPPPPPTTNSIIPSAIRMVAPPPPPTTTISSRIVPLGAFNVVPPPPPPPPPAS
ncbi:hypothetical protein SNEBB_000625 [Seison nebaliae]|nr:hypothetical protein SNEBB_000625 [Seison nebaliae]